MKRFLMSLNYWRGLQWLVRIAYAPVWLCLKIYELCFPLLYQFLIWAGGAIVGVWAIITLLSIIVFFLDLRKGIHNNACFLFTPILALGMFAYGNLDSVLMKTIDIIEDLNDFVYSDTWGRIYISDIGNFFEDWYDWVYKRIKRLVSFIKGGKSDNKEEDIVLNVQFGDNGRILKIEQVTEKENK